MRDKGKHYYSVVDDMLLPANDLGCIVPPSLHILLDITLLLYNNLHYVCKDLDAPGGIDSTNPEKVQLENEYKFASLEVEHLQRIMTVLALDVVTMMNCVNQLQAIMDGNLNENEVVAAMGGGEQHRTAEEKENETDGRCRKMLCW